MHLSSYRRPPLPLVPIALTKLKFMAPFILKKAKILFAMSAALGHNKRYKYAFYGGFTAFAGVMTFFYYSSRDECIATGRHRSIQLDPDEDVQFGQTCAQEFEKKLKFAGTSILPKTDPRTISAQMCLNVLGTTADKLYFSKRPLFNKPKWRVFVMDSPICSSKSFTDGSIYISSAAFEIACTADRLAVLLAHEIGHIVCRHIPEMASKDFSTSLATLPLFLLPLDVVGPFLSFGISVALSDLFTSVNALHDNSTMEGEADKISAVILEEVGIIEPVKLMLSFWKTWLGLRSLTPVEDDSHIVCPLCKSLRMRAMVPWPIRRSTLISIADSSSKSHGDNPVLDSSSSSPSLSSEVYSQSSNLQDLGPHGLFPHFDSKLFTSILLPENEYKQLVVSLAALEAGDAPISQNNSWSFAMSKARNCSPFASVAGLQVLSVSRILGGTLLNQVLMDAGTQARARRQAGYIRKMKRDYVVDIKNERRSSSLQSTPPLSEDKSEKTTTQTSFCNECGIFHNSTKVYQ